MSEKDVTSEQEPQMEAREPSANSITTPAWPFILVVIIFWLGMRYIDAYGGGFSKDVFVRNLDAPPPQLSLSPEQLAMVKGRTIFLRNCGACHQPHGKGVPGQFPPLAGSDWVNGVGPDRIIRLVLDGINGPIKVNGAEFNNAMVPWRPTMSDKEIAYVVSYIRNEADWGNSGSFVTEKEVAAIRAETSSHAGTPYTAEELLGLPDSSGE